MKLGLTKRLITAWVTNFPRPVIMSSFGKDSMVMIHITKSMGLRIPVVYHRAPWFPEKNKFADEQTVKMDLEVHDWPPAACGIKNNGKVLEVGSSYQIAPNSFMSMCYNILAPKAGDRFICARYDMLKRPTCQGFQNPWNFLLVGHKNSDVDNFEGPFALKTHTIQYNDSPIIGFPLRDWDDNDVWDYIDKYRVPVQTDRYDVKNRTNRESKEFNNDYITACTKCIDSRNPSKVECPLFGLIDNVSSEIPSLVTEFEYKV
jgi:hypothetical protein